MTKSVPYWLFFRTFLLPSSDFFSNWVETDYLHVWDFLVQKRAKWQYLPGTFLRKPVIPVPTGGKVRTQNSTRGIEDCCELSTRRIKILSWISRSKEFSVLLRIWKSSDIVAYLDFFPNGSTYWLLTCFFRFPSASSVPTDFFPIVQGWQPGHFIFSTYWLFQYLLTLNLK